MKNEIGDEGIMAWSAKIAPLIGDALVAANLIKASDLPRSIAIAKEEIYVRLVIRNRPARTSIDDNQASGHVTYTPDPQWSESVGGVIAACLVYPKLIEKSDVPRATAVIGKEILTRLSMQDRPPIATNGDEV